MEVRFFRDGPKRKGEEIRLAKILSGIPVAQAIRARAAEQVQDLRERDVFPTLAIVRVGQRGSDVAYQRSAQRCCRELGIETQTVELPADASFSLLEKTFQTINRDEDIHGCLLLRPLPPHLDSALVQGLLLPEKDVDGMTGGSLGGLFTGEDRGFPPCTPAACMAILDHYNVPIRGRRAVVIGKSVTVGMPTAVLLMQREATVSVCHILTDPNHLRSLCLEADILVSAAGHAGLVQRKMVRPGQTIVDIGVNIVPGGHIRGDVDFDQVEDVVEAVTPVPGGVGAVTTSILAEHIVTAAWREAVRQGRVRPR